MKLAPKGKGLGVSRKTTAVRDKRPQGADVRRGKQTGSVCGYAVGHWVACVRPWFDLHIEERGGRGRGLEGGCRNKLMLKPYFMYLPNPYLRGAREGWGYSLMLECLTSKHEALGSNLSTVS